MVVVSCFSLILHWVTAAIWHQQEQFRWLAVGSFVIVSAAVVTYAVWERRWEKQREGNGTMEEEAPLIS